MCIINLNYLRAQILVYIIFIFIHNTSDSYQVSGYLFDIVGNIQFWLGLILTNYIAIIPFLIMRRYELFFSDNLINNIRYNKFEDDYMKKVYIKKLSEMQKYTRSLAKFKKIYNENVNYEPENLADKKIKDMVDTFKSTRPRKSLKNIRKLEEREKIIEMNNEGESPPKVVKPVEANKNENNLNINLIPIANTNNLYQRKVSSLVEKLNKRTSMDTQQEEKQFGYFENFEEVENTKTKKVDKNKQRANKRMITLFDDNELPDEVYMPVTKDPIVHDYPVEISEMFDSEQEYSAKYKTIKRK